MPLVQQQGQQGSAWYSTLERERCEQLRERVRVSVRVRVGVKVRVMVELVNIYIYVVWQRTRGERKNREVIM